MNILVTGSSGYIGSKLVSALQEKGHDVMTCDLEDGEDYEYSVLHGVDVLVHLGAHIDLMESRKDPFKYYTNNVAKMIPLVGQAKVHNTRVVFASSVAASGTSPYGHTKRMGELILKDFGVKYTVLRLHNVCGRGGHGVVDKIMSPFTKEFIRYGDGQRDYIHIDDVIRSIVIATQTELPADIYEVGTGELTKTSELVRLARGAKPGLIDRIHAFRPGEVSIVIHQYPRILSPELLLYPTINDIIRSMV